jgi:hypothetical protein
LSLKNLLNGTTWADKILFSTLILLSFLGIIFIGEVLPKNMTVHIEADGKPAYVLPLDEDRVISVAGHEGKTFVEIKGGRVRITESPCHNKLCIQQGWIRSGVIVCLPNRVIVTIGDHDGKDRIVDAITG